MISEADKTHTHRHKHNHVFVYTYADAFVRMFDGEGSDGGSEGGSEGAGVGAGALTMLAAKHCTEVSIHACIHILLVSYS